MLRCITGAMAGGSAIPTTVSKTLQQAAHMLLLVIQAGLLLDTQCSSWCKQAHLVTWHKEGLCGCSILLEGQQLWALLQSLPHKRVARHLLCGLSASGILFLLPVRRRCRLCWGCRCCGLLCWSCGCCVLLQWGCRCTLWLDVTCSWRGC